MRKQLREVKEIIGLTVRGAVLRGGMGAISFDDDSFIMLEAENCEWGGAVMNIDGYPPKPDYDTVMAGVFMSAIR